MSRVAFFLLVFLSLVGLKGCSKTDLESVQQRNFINEVEDLRELIAEGRKLQYGTKDYDIHKTKVQEIMDHFEKTHPLLNSEIRDWVCQYAGNYWKRDEIRPQEIFRLTEGANYLGDCIRPGTAPKERGLFGASGFGATSLLISNPPTEVDKGALLKFSGVVREIRVRGGLQEAGGYQMRIDPAEVEIIKK